MIRKFHNKPSVEKINFFSFQIYNLIYIVHI